MEMITPGTALKAMKAAKEAGAAYAKATECLIAELLVRSAPEEMRKLLEDDGIARRIAEYGECSGHLHRDDWERYGFKDVASLRQGFWALREAWKGLVSIETRNQVGACGEFQMNFSSWE